MTVHVPASTGVNVDPETLQIVAVVVANATVSPEDAAADIVTAAPFIAGDDGVIKVIV